MSEKCSIFGPLNPAKISEVEGLVCVIIATRGFCARQKSHGFTKGDLSTRVPEFPGNSRNPGNYEGRLARDGRLTREGRLAPRRSPKRGGRASDLLFFDREVSEVKVKVK